MSQYKVVVSKSAAKEFSKQSSAINNRIIKAALIYLKTQDLKDQKSSREAQIHGASG